MAGMQETDRLTLKNGITYLLQDAKAREKLAELLTEVMEKYGPGNPPPYPVTSVNNKTGAVALGARDVGALPDTTQIPSKTSDLTNDSGFVNAAGAAAAAPVQSVNGQTGAVTIQSSPGIAVQDSEPTDGELVWIDTDDPGTAHVIPEIDDSGVSTGDTWSSQKIADEIAAAGADFNLIYPVGSIYMSVNSTDPGTLFGGTWEQLENTFLLAAGSSYAAGSTGGAATHHHSTANHTLTVNEIPAHNHTVTVKGGYGGVKSDGTTIQKGYEATFGTLRSDSATTANKGGGGAHNHGNTGDTSNMPPYLAVYMWKRTA